MRVDDFDFSLDPDLIATRPCTPPEAARLLVVGDSLQDRHVGDLPDLLRPGDVIVCNDTRVIPAQLSGRRDGAAVEVTLHKRQGPGRWRAFAKPARRLRAGDEVRFGDDFVARVRARDGAEVELDFGLDDAGLRAALARYGETPLPPYIRKRRQPDHRDLDDYQTVFAVRDGAVAAPTAGLHFSQDLLDRLAAKGIRRATLTLHVGAGTFLPVSVDDTDDHKMYSEVGEITAATADAINAARAGGGRIVAIGTTSMRLLESAVDDDGRIHAFDGETDIFITPGFRFRAVDLLFTNFHLPRSTLFMLVAAFAGLDRMRAAYAHAQANRYRFYSYGDATLLHPAAA